MSVLVHSNTVFASEKLQSNHRSMTTNRKAAASSGVDGYVTTHNNNRIIQLACKQTEKVQGKKFSKADSDRAVRTVFTLLRSVVGLTMSKKIDKLVQIAKLYKGDDMILRLKEKNSVVSMRNILCGPAAGSREMSFRAIGEKTTAAAGESGPAEAAAAAPTGGTGSGTGSGTGGNGGLPALCINQKDGAICGTAPLGLCCRQKCLKAYSFGFMCPRLCPVTAEAGDTCTQRAPDDSEEADGNATTTTAGGRFCCAKVPGAGAAMECLDKKDYNAYCGGVEANVGKSAFSPDKETAEAALETTKQYWQDRSVCSGKGDGVDCSAVGNNVAALKLYCCKDKCMTVDTFRAQCPRSGGAVKGDFTDFQASFHHNFSAPTDPERIETPAGRPGSMPKPYFSRASNYSVMNLIPTPPLQRPSIEPALSELHPAINGNAKATAAPAGGASGSAMGDVPVMPGKVAGAGMQPQEAGLAGGADQKGAKPHTPVEARSVQEYDPFPSANAVCPVGFLTIKRDDETVDGVTPKDVAQHVGRYTGVWDVQGDNEKAQVQLYAPSRLPFAKLGRHFFADLDGRYTFAAMMTAGGDMGEFVGAMCALEKTRHDGTRLLSLPDVKSLFQGWLQVSGERRGKFFMQTDSMAFSRFETAVGITGFLRPEKVKLLDKEDKKNILNMAAIPGHVGSAHLRNMLLKPDEYSCRSALTEYAITAFFELLLSSPENPLANKLVYHIAKGYHEESAVVNVYSLKGECNDHVPLIVPGVRADADTGASPVTSAFVLHPSAVHSFRGELATYFSSRMKTQLRGGQESLLKAMTEIATGGLKVTLKTIAKGLPRFSAFFSTSSVSKSFD